MCAREQKLKRLLHYGREIPFYQPGDKLTDEECLSTLSSKIILDTEIFTDAANSIVKAFSDGYSAHPCMLVFALAVCAKQKKSSELREAAYKAAKTVCSSAEHLLLFVKLANKIAATSENDSCWGSGLRKVCKQWYLQRDAKSLAEIVGKNKKLHGWFHKDIIKLIHLKTVEPDKAAIVKYILFGIKAAKKEFGENSEANEVLNYLQAVEDFKHLTDEQQAARSIEIHHFTLDHVPPHLLKSKEVWGALIGNLPLPVLLKNLERIGYIGFLKPNSILVNKVVDALNDETAIAESHLHPAQVYIFLRNYEMSSKFLAAENARKKRRAENGSGEPKKFTKAAPKPNPKIISALHDLFTSTCKLFLAPTGLRYFVAIDLKSLSPTDKCYRCSHVSPAQAGVLTTLCLLHADRNVSVCVAGAREELVPVELSASMTVQQGVKKLEEAGMQRMKISTPIEWALKKKEEYDVFILITDTIHKGNNNAICALQKYREEMNIPKAKLIAVLLKCHFEPTWVRDLNDPGVFVVGGFDGLVPRLIEAFSRGAF
ncbi:hypothetical protein RUM43_010724 [Polyplax serrata]|uniref:TROVE domain-containing protein n=1 Tax=Polyplax serrata TaxID=468196 RepID=A0AAN8PLP9_POLSC